MPLPSKETSAAAGQAAPAPQAQQPPCPHDGHAELLALVRRLASDVLYMDEIPGDTQPLMRAGMTSMGASRLQKLLSQELPRLHESGVSFLEVVPSTLVMDHPTIAGIARFLRGHQSPGSPRATLPETVKSRDALPQESVQKAEMKEGSEVVGEPFQWAVPLGAGCLGASWLQERGLRTCALPFDWAFSSPSMVRDCLHDDFHSLLDVQQYTSLWKMGAGVGHKRYSTMRLPGRRQGFVFLHFDPLRKRQDHAYLRHCVERFRRIARSPGRKLYVLCQHVESAEELRMLRGETPATDSEEGSCKADPGGCSWLSGHKEEIKRLFDDLQVYGARNFHLAAVNVCTGSASSARGKPEVRQLKTQMNGTPADTSRSETFSLVDFHTVHGHSGRLFKFFNDVRDEEAFTECLLGESQFALDKGFLDEYEPSGYREKLAKDVAGRTLAQGDGRNAPHACEKCGLAFNSKNRLFAHLRQSDCLTSSLSPGPRAKATEKVAILVGCRYNVSNWHASLLQSIGLDSNSSHAALASEPRAPRMPRLERSAARLCDVLSLAAEALPSSLSCAEWCAKINEAMPPGLCVLARSEALPNEFHADSCWRRCYECLVPVSLLIQTNLPNGSSGNGASTVSEVLANAELSCRGGDCNDLEGIGVLRGQLQKLKNLLRSFCGQHPLHNFSAQSSDFSQVAALRYLYRFRAATDVGCDMIALSAGADSLSSEQLRSIAGLVIAIQQGLVPERYLDAAFLPEVSLPLPAVPEAAAYLAGCVYPKQYHHLLQPLMEDKAAQAWRHDTRLQLVEELQQNRIFEVWYHDDLLPAVPKMLAALDLLERGCATADVECGLPAQGCERATGHCNQHLV